MPLVDHLGRPLRRADLLVEQAAPTSGSIRRPRDQDEASGLNPVRLARLLKASVGGDAAAYLALAEDIEERDLHYAGVLGTRKMQVSGLEIVVDAAGDDADSIADADLARAVTARDAFQTELTDILDAIGKGISHTEILWDMSERQWMVAALRWRDPTWFAFDPADGETSLLRENGGNVPLAPSKWIVHQAKVKSGLPVRGGIARAACWSYLFKSFAQRDWAIFVEAYGQPLRIGKWGEGASEDDKRTLFNAVSMIGTDYAATIPASMAIEFVKADVSGSHELYEKRCDWLDRQVSKLVLGQTGTTDAVAGGYAVGRVHDGVRADIEASDARQLAATLNRDLVRPLVSLNRGVPRSGAYPKIRLVRAERADAQWMTAVRTFVELGGTVGMSTVRDRLGLPDPGKGEDLLMAPAAAPAAPPPGSRLAAQRAAPPMQTRDAVDRAVAAALDENGWEPLVAPVVSGLADRLAGAVSLEEARTILADQVRTMDVAALTRILERLSFAARLAGEHDEDLA